SLGEIYFFEGTGKVPVWKFDLATERWSACSDALLPIKPGFASACVDEKRRRVLFVGGNSDDMYGDNQEAKVWAYYVDSGKWKSLAASGELPTGRKNWLAACIDPR